MTTFLLKHLKRREWTANRADPTAVTQWSWHPKRVGAPGPTGGWRFGLVMIASWGVEAKVTAFGRTWRTYDNRFFVWLFAVLENAHAERELAYDEDPMGHLSDYK